MRGGEDGENINVIIQRIREFETQLDNFIEMKNFQGILDAIFNGNLKLISIYEMLVFNEKFKKDMIDYILHSSENENKNKYFFIICCDNILHSDKDNKVFDYLILQIGIDKFIEIVYGTDYGTAFDRIIYQYTNSIMKLDRYKIDIIKYTIFIELLKIYSKKMSLDEFKELLIKLFSIQDKSFMTNIANFLHELFNFFTNVYVYPKIQPSFRLLEFLLENKEKLRDFIRIFKNFFTAPQRFIHPRTIKIIGTINTQEELFRNV